MSKVFVKIKLFFSIQVETKIVLGEYQYQPRMWKRLFFNRFRFHKQKTRKQPLTIFLTFVGL